MKTKNIRRTALTLGALAVLIAGSANTYAQEPPIDYYAYVGRDTGMGPKCPPMQYHLVQKAKGQLEGVAYTNVEGGMELYNVNGGIGSDGKVNLIIPDLLDEFSELPAAGPDRDDAFPFVLSAGERRSSTANTILRDPTWMKADHAGALRMSPGDAARLGVADGDGVVIETKRGRAETVVEITDTLQDGHVSLPNGRGLSYPDDDGVDQVRAIAPNELTADDDRDWLALTPHHKTVRARVEAAV